MHFNMDHCLIPEHQSHKHHGKVNGMRAQDEFLLSAFLNTDGFSHQCIDVRDFIVLLEHLLFLCPFSEKVGPGRPLFHTGLNLAPPWNVWQCSRNGWMLDKLQCPQESSVKHADRCQRRGLRQNTTKGDTAEASWWLGSLGRIPRARSMVELCSVLYPFLVSGISSAKPLHKRPKKLHLIPWGNFQQDWQLLVHFVFVLWLYFRGHTCWTWFFPLATARCSKRFSSSRAGRTVLSPCSSAMKKSSTFPPKSDKMKETVNGVQSLEKAYFLNMSDTLYWTWCSNTEHVPSSSGTVSYSLGHCHIFLERLYFHPWPWSHIIAFLCLPLSLSL